MLAIPGFPETFNRTAFVVLLAFAITAWRRDGRGQWVMP